jgi:hypothetical protein
MSGAPSSSSEVSCRDVGTRLYEIRDGHSFMSRQSQAGEDEMFIDYG